MPMYLYASSITWLTLSPCLMRNLTIPFTIPWWVLTTDFLTMLTSGASGLCVNIFYTKVLIYYPMYYL